MEEPNENSLRKFRVNNEFQSTVRSKLGLKYPSCPLSHASLSLQQNSQELEDVSYVARHVADQKPAHQDTRWSQMGKFMFLLPWNHFLHFSRNNCTIQVSLQKIYFSDILQLSCLRSIIHQTFTAPSPWARHLAESSIAPSMWELWDCGGISSFPFAFLYSCQTPGNMAQLTVWKPTRACYLLAFVLASSSLQKTVSSYFSAWKYSYIYLPSPAHSLHPLGGLSQVEIFFDLLTLCAGALRPACTGTAWKAGCLSWYFRLLRSRMQPRNQHFEEVSE